MLLQVTTADGKVTPIPCDKDVLREVLRGVWDEGLGRAKAKFLAHPKHDFDVRAKTMHCAVWFDRLYCCPAQGDVRISGFYIALCRAYCAVLLAVEVPLR